MSYVGGYGYDVVTIALAIYSDVELKHARCPLMVATPVGLAGELDLMCFRELWELPIAARGRTALSRRRLSINQSINQSINFKVCLGIFQRSIRLNMCYLDSLWSLDTCLFHIMICQEDCLCARSAE